MPRAYAVASVHPFYVAPEGKAGLGSSGYQPRSWRLVGRLRGAADGATDWVVLREHVNDTSLHLSNPSHVWDVVRPVSPPAPPFFDCFRIEVTGPNALGSCALQLSGFEVFGRVLYAQMPGGWGVPPPPRPVPPPTGSTPSPDRRWFNSSTAEPPQGAAELGLELLRLQSVSVAAVDAPGAEFTSPHAVTSPLPRRYSTTYSALPSTAPAAARRAPSPPPPMPPQDPKWMPEDKRKGKGKRKGKKK